MVAQSAALPILCCYPIVPSVMLWSSSHRPIVHQLGLLSHGGWHFFCSKLFYAYCDWIGSFQDGLHWLDQGKKKGLSHVPRAKVCRFTFAALPPWCAESNFWFFVSPEFSSGRDLVIQISVQRVPSAIRRPWFFVRSISREPYDLPWWYLVCGWV